MELLVFYVYLWLRYNGSVYYVGKGSKGRAHTSYAHGVHRPADKSRILVQYYESEEEAFEAEKFFIAYYGRQDLGTGYLRNLTDGGEGASGAVSKKKGIKLSEETKKKVSDTLKRKGIVPPNQTGFHHSDATKKKIQGTSTGKPKTKEHVRKVAEALKALPTKATTCHPDRRHHGLGLCKSCYTVLKRREKRRLNGSKNPSVL